jgi:hypothetical protein
MRETGRRLPQEPAANEGLITPCKKRAAVAALNRLHERYIGQIFQMASMPGIWTNGPLAGGPTKCESAPRSRTAP